MIVAGSAISGLVERRWRRSAGGHGRCPREGLAMIVRRRLLLVMIARSWRGGPFIAQRPQFVRRAKRPAIGRKRSLGQRGMTTVDGSPICLGLGP
jgi:hypothetical protein